MKIVKASQRKQELRDGTRLDIYDWRTEAGCQKRKAVEPSAQLQGHIDTDPGVLGHETRDFCFHMVKLQSHLEQDMLRTSRRVYGDSFSEPLSDICSVWCQEVRFTFAVHELDSLLAEAWC